MRRALLSWTLVFALLAAGFGASVLALNGDLYSAHGFVRSYLQTLQRHDAEAALATPGVVGASPLVTDATVGGFDDIRLVSDVSSGEKSIVRYAYTIDGGEQVSEFTVERTGTRMGLFATWRFAVSPIATLAVSVDHDSRFAANGTDAVAGTHTMLVPSAVTLTHDTRYLEALPTLAVVTEVGSTVEAAVAVAPKDSFAEAATEAMKAHLDTCATQTVLKPTGCPFGTDVANRVDSAPTWTMVDYPIAELSPEGLAWQTEGEGIAHVTVAVKSLFDGTLSTLDKDVPFSAVFTVTIAADDSLSVTSA